METINKPQLEQLKAGEELQVLLVKGKKGDFMPNHKIPGEGVIFVTAGKAVLEMKDTSSILRKGDVFLIPKAAIHSLEIHEDFEATVTMAVNSTIKFEKI